VIYVAALLDDLSEVDMDNAGKCLTSNQQLHRLRLTQVQIIVNAKTLTYDVPVKAR
jgi:hypothetical protein